MLKAAVSAFGEQHTQFFYFVGDCFFLLPAFHPRHDCFVCGEGLTRSFDNANAYDDYVLISLYVCLLMCIGIIVSASDR